MEFFTFLKKQDIFHFRGTPLLNGLFGVEKKNKILENGEPVLRMIINAIPANALQETIEADIRTLPYFVQWSAISVDEEDKVMIWNERRTCSASSRRYRFQALAKPVSGPFAAQSGRPICGDRETGVPCSWQSWPWDGSQRADSCNRSTGSFASSQSPWEQDVDPSREVRCDGPVPRSSRPQMQASTACIWMGSAMPSSSIGTSSAITKSGVGKAHGSARSLDHWGVPSQAEKAIS